jgi:hypothetical protein
MDKFVTAPKLAVLDGRGLKVAAAWSSRLGYLGVPG